MITNLQQQAAWIAYLKSIPAVISPVLAVEVREDSWKGDKFVYPNIRVQANNVEPHVNPNCNQTTGNVSILVFSEQKSSYQADLIAGNIANYIHGKSFSSGGVRFVGVTVTNLLAAVAESDILWRSVIVVRSLLS